MASDDATGEPGETAAESPWAASVVLASGDAAYIRPMRPDDRDALAAFHGRQSAESVYRRYFSPKPSLTDAELDRFTTVDMVDRAALVVEVHDEFVAWASYERWPGRNEAEAAFMVDDDHHGQGIATLLLEHLAAIARANGIEHFTAEVLADNRAMLAVFAKAGWPLQRRFESGVVDLDWELATTEEFLDSVERREQRADSRAVARILLPRAIAVIGASDRPGSVGAELWHHVSRGVDVPVYPVNPHRERLDGHVCLPSVEDLPDEVSLAVVAVPAAALEATIDACMAKRMRGAVIVTRVDGVGVDIDVDAMVTRARRHGLRIIGPSSMGVASRWPEARLQATLVDVRLPPGNVAISMQSGSLGGSLLRQAEHLRLGLSWFVSLGDKSDISGNDLLQFWEDDERTRVVAMYTETFGNPRKFARIARRVSRQMPIVAVRTGAAASGVMGGALYQQAGLIEVPTVTALLDTARVLATQPILRGPRVAVVTNSRSPGVLASAALETAGLEPVPSALDWRAGVGELGRALAAALASEDVDGVLVIHAPAVVADVDAPPAEIAAAARGADKPVVAVLLGGEDGPLVDGSEVPAFTFPEPAAAVLGRSYSYARWLDTETADDEAAALPVDPVRARSLIAQVLGERGEQGAGDGAAEPVVAGVAVERGLLAAYGIVMAPAVETTPDEVVAAARRIGYPVAIKAARRKVGHSVRAGIALDIGSDDEARDAATIIAESLGPDGQHLVVQQMSAPGLDVRVRCELDERLGVIVSVGLGGAQADVIADRTSRLAPVSPATARRMLAETRIATALAEADLDASDLVDLVVLAAQLASDHPEIVELDLNPIVLSAERAVVTDAVVRLHHPTTATAALRRL